MRRRTLKKPASDFETVVPTQKTAVAIAAVALVFALLFSGCAQSQDNGNPQQRKTIKVSGAFALYPMMAKWAEEYNKLHPDVRIDVSAGGAGKGMTDVLSGMVDIGMVSRDIDPVEIKNGAYPVKCVTDAVVVVANADNPNAGALENSGVGKEKLKSLYVGGDADSAFTVYRRSDSCGASDTFAKYLGAKQEDLKGIGVFGDPGIVEAVKKDRKGIGYANLNFAYDMKTGMPTDGIIVVPLEGTDRAIYADKKSLTAAIASKKFPWPPARELYLVGKGKFTGETAEFVQWILNDGQQYVEETGYVRLDAGTLESEKGKIGSG